jgi:retron-type reverse transcriptase
MEISETVRQIVRKRGEAGLDTVVLKSDIKRAFDNIDHAILLKALEKDTVPPRLLRALMLELHGCRLTFRFQGEEWI